MGRAHPIFGQNDNQGQTMPTAKVRYILGLVLCIIFITGCYTAINFTVLIQDGTQSTELVWLLLQTGMMRFLHTALCCVLAFSVGVHYLNLRDRRLIIWTFTVCLWADLFLISGLELPGWIEACLGVLPLTDISDSNLGIRAIYMGILLFAIAHLILTVRHGKDFFTTGFSHTIRRHYLLIAVLIGILSISILYRYWDDIGQEHKTLAVCYMSIISLSLFSAWTMPYRKAFPLRNRNLAITGITSFAITDIAIGLEILVSEKLDHFKLISTLPDICYSLALVMLALSAFSWEGYGRNLRVSKKPEHPVYPGAPPALTP